MSKVSRSVYQKVVEENKRLMADIRLLTDKVPSAERILCIAKWRNKFDKEREFNEMMKLAAKSYIENNPEDPAVVAYKEITSKNQDLI